jgi:hypothetical protein
MPGGQGQNDKAEEAQIKLDTLVMAYARIQAEADDLANQLDYVKSTLTKVMTEEQRKAHEVTDGGKVYRATFVQASVPIIDEKGLREELGNEVVDSYCKLVLDRKALESAMEDGAVDPYKVGKHVTERKNKPSVRFTIRAADDT